MNYTFNIKKSNMVKGIAILLLLFHHLFYYPGDYINKLADLNVNAYPMNLYQLGKIAELFKLCVSLFVFISAYGITKKLTKMRLKENIKSSIKRYIKLYSNYLLIFSLFMILGLIFSINNFEVYNNNLYYFINDLLAYLIYGTPLYNYTWWYMGLAIFIIFIVPYIIEINKRGGGEELIILSLLIPVLQINSELLNRYFPIICIGVYCGYTEVLENICKKYSLVFLNVFLLIICWLEIKTGSYYLIEPLQVLLVCSIVLKSSFLESALNYLGKHSMNIFLTHTFLYYYFAQDFIYSSSHFILVFFVLLICSIIISTLINIIKKIMHFDYIVIKITKKVGVL